MKCDKGSYIGTVIQHFYTRSGIKLFRIPELYPIGFSFLKLALALFLDGVILDAQACLW